MAKVTLPKLASFHRGDLHLRKGVNENVPLHLVQDLIGDKRFVIDLEGESLSAAVEHAAQLVTETDDGGVPKDKLHRLRLIAGAIPALDLDNEAHWTNSGKPDARALTQLLGWQVTSIDRDEAHDRLTKGTIEPIDYVSPDETEEEQTETEGETGGDDQGGENTTKTDPEPTTTETAPQSAPKGKLTLGSKTTKKPKAQPAADPSTDGAQEV